MSDWRLARATFSHHEAEIRARWDAGERIVPVAGMEFGRRAGYDPQTGLHTHVVVARLPPDPSPAFVLMIETIPPLFREPLPFDGVFAP